MTLSTCKNKCYKFYPNRITNTVHNWVQKGLIKCMTCNIYVNKEAENTTYCMCCGYRFRRSVRNKHSKEYYRTVQKPQIQKERDIIIHWKQKRYTDRAAEKERT